MLHNSLVRDLIAHLLKTRQAKMSLFTDEEIMQVNGYICLRLRAKGLPTNHANKKEQLKSDVDGWRSVGLSFPLFNYVLSKW